LVGDVLVVDDLIEDICARALCSLTLSLTLFPVSFFLFPVSCFLFPVSCFLFPVSCFLFLFPVPLLQLLPEE